MTEFCFCFCYWKYSQSVIVINHSAGNAAKVLNLNIFSQSTAHNGGNLLLSVWFHWKITGAEFFQLYTSRCSAKDQAPLQKRRHWFVFCTIEWAFKRHTQGAILAEEDTRTSQKAGVFEADGAVFNLTWQKEELFSFSLLSFLAFRFRHDESCTCLCCWCLTGWACTQGSICKAHITQLQPHRSLHNTCCCCFPLLGSVYSLLQDHSKLHFHRDILNQLIAVLPEGLKNLQMSFTHSQLLLFPWGHAL